MKPRMLPRCCVSGSVRAVLVVVLSCCVSGSVNGSVSVRYNSGVTSCVNSRDRNRVRKLC